MSTKSSLTPSRFTSSLGVWTIRLLNYKVYGSASCFLRLERWVPRWTYQLSRGVRLEFVDFSSCLPPLELIAEPSKLGALHGSRSRYIDSSRHRGSVYS